LERQRPGLGTLSAEELLQVLLAEVIEDRNGARNGDKHCQGTARIRMIHNAFTVDVASNQVVES